MDKTILNLLFNYNGTITYREFRVGISVLFMLLGTYLNTLLDPMLTSLIAGRIGGEWIASIIIYNQITYSFTPNLVPVWFIVSYSSFVLARKRVRMLNNDRTITTTSGIVNYLFFASFIALITIGTYQVSMQQNELYMSVVKPVLIYTINAFFVIGLANLIYLCFRRESEHAYCAYQKGRLDISAYSTKMGNLIGITIIVSIIISVILILSDFMLLLLLPSEKAQLILVLCSLIPLFFYIKYSAYRLRDANISILWLVSILIIYVIMLSLKIWINLHCQSNLTLYYNTLFAIVTSFFIASQYILFLLPTKNNRQKSNDEQ